MDVVIAIYLVVIFVILYFTSFNFLLFLKFRKRAKKEKGREINLPSISLIVPAYNEEKTVAKTIKNLLRLNYPKDKLEIIVVDDGSKDETYKIAKRFERNGVRVFRKENSGKAATLNFGIKRAKGEIVGVVDCDTILEKNALMKCVKYFDEEGVACVTSRILQRRKKKILEKWQDLELKLIAYLRKLSQYLNLITATPGPLSLYRKKVLTRLGGFDEKCCLEDNEIAWRLIFHGFKVKMAYDAKAFTNMPCEIGKWWRQRVRWGIGGLQIIGKYFSSLFRNHPLGTYILPSSILGYAFSILGLGLFFYLFYFSLLVNLLYFIKVLSYGGNPLVFSIQFNFDVLFFYGAFLFFLSFFFAAYVLYTYKERPNPFLFLTFIFVYLVHYPFVSLYSMYKFLLLRKQLKIKPVWLTK
jgi:cellulose synthase/poly-beta-1,6-N-acetylglucosamine synthase-like glycosyltransferase